MRLEVEPPDGLVDEAPEIRVSEAGESEVNLKVAAVDAAGHRWESRSVFLPDHDGTVDVGRDAPISGGYEGVDPSGPFWSMEFAKCRWPFRRRLTASNTPSRRVPKTPRRRR